MRKDLSENKMWFISQVSAKILTETVRINGGKIDFPLIMKQGSLLYLVVKVRDHQEVIGGHMRKEKLISGL
jgi:Holliday junction resolvase-like predicted endonuclease